MNYKPIMQYPLAARYLEEQMLDEYVELYETIQEHYPIGISAKYEGIDKLRQIKNLTRKINGGALRKTNLKKWNVYLDRLSKVFPSYKITRNTIIQPTYGGIVEIQRQDGEQIITKELHFYKSLLGNYYTILGIDRIHYYRNELYYMRFDPIVTISPFDDYEIGFKMLRDQMKDDYPDYKYVPYFIGTLKIRGLSAIYSETEGDSTINEALFVNHDYSKYNYIGDWKYGYEDWGGITENWTAYPQIDKDN